MISSWNRAKLTFEIPTLIFEFQILIYEIQRFKG